MSPLAAGVVAKFTFQDTKRITESFDFLRLCFLLFKVCNASNNEHYCIIQKKNERKICLFNCIPIIDGKSGSFIFRNSTVNVHRKDYRSDLSHKEKKKSFSLFWVYAKLFKTDHRREFLHQFSLNISFYLCVVLHRWLCVVTVTAIWYQKNESHPLTTNGSFWFH